MTLEVECLTALDRFASVLSCFFCSCCGSTTLSRFTCRACSTLTRTDSSNGRFELIVDPSDLYGCGQAKYQFKADGKERWSKTLPYTLCRAAVTDRGLIVGYGYTKSPGGFWKRGEGEGMGEFLVVLLDADGKLRLKESQEVQNGFVDGRPMPIDDGLIVDEPNDRVIVRLSDIEGGILREKWWISRLSTATPLRKYAGRADGDRSPSGRFWA